MSCNVLLTFELFNIPETITNQMLTVKKGTVYVLIPHSIPISLCCKNNTIKIIQQQMSAICTLKAIPS